MPYNMDAGYGEGIDNIDPMHQTYPSQQYQHQHQNQNQNHQQPHQQQYHLQESEPADSEQQGTG